MKNPTLSFAVIFGRLMRSYKAGDLTSYKKALEEAEPFLPDFLYDAYYNLTFQNSFTKKGYK